MSLGIVSRLSFVVVVATAGLLLLRSAQDLFGGEMLGGDYTFFVPRLACPLLLPVAASSSSES